MEKLHEISIIVVNYNGFKDTRDLLESISRHLYSLSIEVIVVDNGSKIDETIKLSEEFDNVTFIRSHLNLGFAGGNNLGIKASKGEYIFLLNNDTLLVDDSLLFLRDTLKNDFNIGVVSPKIHYFEPANTLQYAGYTPISAITIRNSQPGCGEYDRGQYNTPGETAYSHGAAMMFRRELIDVVGLLPEEFFLYYEEIDWCERVKNSGFSVFYQPKALVIHKESQTTGKDSFVKYYYMTRNRLLYALRNRKGVVRILSIVYQIAVANTRLVVVSLLKKRFDIASAAIKGVKDFITGKYYGRDFIKSR